MSKEHRYLLTEEEFFKIVDLSSSFGLAVEKIILNSRLPKVYKWEHPAIKGYEDLVKTELERKKPVPDIDKLF
jgi:hypothetical protein